MASKHTPGPWLLSPDWRPSPHAVVDTQNVYAGPRIGVLANVVMVAQDGQNLEERAANARLIAAAPETHEALARMVEHFGEWAKYHSHEATAETWAALHCARAALSKAEGQ